ncbi:Expressed protein [hydrothermal vent metagenome]|uniref:Expressed protein n=1 Tax=hydrothermal vent metagenome TaxID=652676 RepID=A0A1W1EJ30_9ZZZZ
MKKYILLLILLIFTSCTNSKIKKDIALTPIILEESSSAGGDISSPTLEVSSVVASTIVGSIKSTPSTIKTSYRTKVKVEAGVLTAGDIDDRLNIKYFKKYIQDRKDKNYLSININQYSKLKPQNISSKKLDLSFVIDTTGSMGDEMSYLSKELLDIIENINRDYPKIDIRVALTLYRDIGDDYVVRNFDFDSNIQEVVSNLKKQSANGGGDYPEAMDKGLFKGLSNLWRNNSIKVMFLLADAPPHSQNIKNIQTIIKRARVKGVRIYPISGSGVDDKTEFIMRHIAFLTDAKYIFLSNDSGVGNSHKEPKIKCYQVTKLNNLIQRVIESEISGEKLEASQKDIIRRVGNYDKGVCR